MCWQKDEEEELIRRAQEGMNAEECQFSVEFPVKQEALVWSDKYRPRKPRFFNRVHTVRCFTVLLFVLFQFGYSVVGTDAFLSAVCFLLCLLWMFKTGIRVEQVQPNSL